MKRHIGLVLGVVGSVLSLSTASFADDTTVVQAPPPAQPPAQTTVVAAPQPQPVAAEHTAGYVGPNVPMITTGLVTFGLSYIPALVVAGESTQSADHSLYVPLAGPWIDIANRPACGNGGPDCNTENTDKVLIGVDGVFQGVGAVMTVIGLLTPERHHDYVTTTAAADKPTVSVSPTRVGSGYGLGAVGSW